jgi:hypothetical protein
LRGIERAKNFPTPPIAFTLHLCFPPWCAESPRAQADRFDGLRKDSQIEFFVLP